MTQPPSETCNGQTTAGGLCELPSGWGTAHVGYGRCKLHGGSSRSGEVAAARQAAVVLASELRMAPQDALLWTVWLAAAEVDYFNQRVADLDGEKILVEHDRRGPELNAYLRARNDANERLARYSKMALDAGIAERQVRISEVQLELLTDAFSLLLDSLALTREQWKAAPAAVRASWRCSPAMLRT